MPSVTGSWRRRGSNGRFVASKPLDVSLCPLGVVLLVIGSSIRKSSRVRSLNFRNRRERGCCRLDCARVVGGTG